MKKKINKSILSLLATFCVSSLGYTWTATIDVYQTLLDSPFGSPQASGGLLFVQVAPTGNFSGPATGAFTTGDNFRLTYLVGPQSADDPTITSVGFDSVYLEPGSAFMQLIAINYAFGTTYVDQAGNQYQPGALLRLVWFPTLTPSSTALDVVPGLPYAVSTGPSATQVVPVDTGSFNWVMNDWQWFFIPEPKQVVVLFLTALLLASFFIRRFNSRSKGISA